MTGASRPQLRTWASRRCLSSRTVPTSGYPARRSDEALGIARCADGVRAALILPLKRRLRNNAHVHTQQSGSMLTTRRVVRQETRLLRMEWLHVSESTLSGDHAAAPHRRSGDAQRLIKTVSARYPLRWHSARGAGSVESSQVRQLGGSRSSLS